MKNNAKSLEGHKYNACSAVYTGGYANAIVHPPNWVVRPMSSEYILLSRGETSESFGATIPICRTGGQVEYKGIRKEGGRTCILEAGT